MSVNNYGCPHLWDPPHAHAGTIRIVVGMCNRMMDSHVLLDSRAGGPNRTGGQRMATGSTSSATQSTSSNATQHRRYGYAHAAGASGISSDTSSDTSLLLNVMFGTAPLASHAHSHATTKIHEFDAPARVLLTQVAALPLPNGYQSSSTRSTPRRHGQRPRSSTPTDTNASSFSSSPVKMRPGSFSDQSQLSASAAQDTTGAFPARQWHSGASSNSLAASFRPSLASLPLSSSSLATSSGPNSRTASPDPDETGEASFLRPVREEDEDDLDSTGRSRASSNASLGHSNSMSSSRSHANTAQTGISFSQLTHQQRRLHRSRQADIKFGIKFSSPRRAATAQPAPDKSSPMFGVCVVVNVEKNAVLQQFLFTHFAVLEGFLTEFYSALQTVVFNQISAVATQTSTLAGRVQSSKPNALHPRVLARTLQASGTLRRAANRLRRHMISLYLAPRIQEPAWLTLTTFSSMRRATRVHLVNTFRGFCEEAPAAPSEQVNFLSSCLTACLLQHLGWIPGAAFPEFGDNFSRSTPGGLFHAFGQLAYPPLWAQLADLTGGFASPARYSFSVVTGEAQHEPLMAQLLYILSYFVRCSEVFEVIAMPKKYAIAPLVLSPGRKPDTSARQMGVLSTGELEARQTPPSSPKTILQTAQTVASPASAVGSYTSAQLQGIQSPRSPGSASDDSVDAFFTPLKTLRIRDGDDEADDELNVRESSPRRDGAATHEDVTLSPIGTSTDRDFGHPTSTASVQDGKINPSSWAPLSSAQAATDSGHGMNGGMHAKEQREEPAVQFHPPKQPSSAEPILQEVGLRSTSSAMVFPDLSLAAMESRARSEKQKRTPLSQVRDFLYQRSLGRSLLLSTTSEFIPGPVLQGVVLNPGEDSPQDLSTAKKRGASARRKLQKQILRRLDACLMQPPSQMDVATTSCCIMDVSSNAVVLISAQHKEDEPVEDGDSPTRSDDVSFQPKHAKFVVNASQMVKVMVTSVLGLCSLGMEAEFIAEHIEDRLQDLLSSSRLLISFVEERCGEAGPASTVPVASGSAANSSPLRAAPQTSAKRLLISCSDLAGLLHVDETDMPLLLAIASTQSPDLHTRLSIVDLEWW